MSREKEELLAVRSNLVLANLCAANLLRWSSDGNRNYKYNYESLQKLDQQQQSPTAIQLCSFLFFLSISIQYFHFPALRWWSLYQLYTSGTSSSSQFSNLHMVAAQFWWSQYQLYTTGTRLPSTPQSPPSLSASSTLSGKYPRCTLLRHYIRNIVDNPQLSYRATWAVLPWTIVVLAWISLLPRIASIKVFYFY